MCGAALKHPLGRRGKGIGKIIKHLCTGLAKAS